MMTPGRSADVEVDRDPPARAVVEAAELERRTDRDDAPLRRRRLKTIAGPAVLAAHRQRDAGADREVALEPLVGRQDVHLERSPASACRG